MDRRKFINATATVLIATPLAVRAQPLDKIRHIGWLSLEQPPTPAFIKEAWAPARELGWIEGQNLIVERRYANGNAELLQPFAVELVRRKVEVIGTDGTDATLAAKNATSSIPIIFHSAGDPVGAGLVASLAHPGGNITGISVIGQGIDAKGLSLLHELLPNARRLGALRNSTNPYFRLTRDEYDKVFRSLSMQPIFVEVGAASALESAVAEVARRGGQALIVPSDGLFLANRVSIMGAARRYALPTLVEGRDYLEAGALLSYGVNWNEQHRRFLALLDKILRGANPANLPVEQATKFELLINMKTARALRITIPKSLLLRADEVIE